MLVTPLKWHLLAMHSPRTMLMLQISQAHMHWVPHTPFMLELCILLNLNTSSIISTWYLHAQAQVFLSFSCHI
jgi:hypothetical protein